MEGSDLQPSPMNVSVNWAGSESACVYRSLLPSRFCHPLEYWTRMAVEGSRLLFPNRAVRLWPATRSLHILRNCIH